MTGTDSAGKFALIGLLELAAMAGLLTLGWEILLHPDEPQTYRLTALLVLWTISVALLRIAGVSMTLDGRSVNGGFYFFLCFRVARIWLALYLWLSFQSPGAASIVGMILFAAAYWLSVGILSFLTMGQNWSWVANLTSITLLQIAFLAVAGPLLVTNIELTFLEGVTFAISSLWMASWAFALLFYAVVFLRGASLLAGQRRTSW